METIVESILYLVLRKRSIRIDVFNFIEAYTLFLTKHYRYRRGPCQKCYAT